MPCQTDTTWPPGLLTIFEHSRARNTTFENRYYGPYDKLLNYCFGQSFNYYIAPQNFPTADSRDMVDFIVFLVKSELRSRADKQMRDRYALMLDDCPIPRLWGLSVLGTSFRAYCGDRESYEIDPQAVPRPEPTTRLLSPNFLADGGTMDILSQEGFEKMKEILEYQRELEDSVDQLKEERDMWKNRAMTYQALLNSHGLAAPDL
ncbi:hypothetical protein FIBSPDRAFT_946859 [Athelia psychrophila]|uniref:Uncharacterized protein n=1 Tax=Athelia psychrophila TaxID=1759441 RepID=A0A166SA73_9AGAM|nr:hypothetical protein FIBSPDRAFT_946859 [Fibularhizoctonia sp. CBS 109695]